MERRWFFAAALALAVGATCGAIASANHGWPGSHASFPFRTMRPLHVTLSTAWIFLAYLAALRVLVPRACGVEWRHPMLSKLAFWLMAAAGATAVGGYLTGRWTGREYVELMPAASAMILVAWALFLVAYFRTVAARARPWPAYLWMWSCGLALFTVTFVEAHLWMLPYFRDNIARDLTVQWKSYGSLVGSWNLVVYGLALYLTERVSGDETAGSQPLAYATFWLGLANLFLGWAHHTYQIPQWAGLKWMSFVMSMTEWSILAHILWSRARAPAETRPTALPRAAAGLFLRSAAFWIGVNLLLALLISIPRLNAVSHGTPVTIAHAMGATIGINTMILWAAGFHVLAERGRDGTYAWLRAGAVVVNASLAGFFACLLVAGAIKGRGMVEQGWSFHAASEAARPWMMGFSILGGILWIGILLLCGVWLRLLFRAPQPVRLPEARWRGFPAPVYAAVAAAITTVPWWWPVSLPDVPGVPASAHAGRAVYIREACWRCHGRETDAPDLFAEGPPWSDGWHRAHLFAPQSMRPDSRMTPFRELSDADTRAVGAFVRSFQAERTRRLSENVGAPLEMPADAVPGERARCLYMMSCAGCHGLDGRGDGPLARFLDGEAQPRDFSTGIFRRRDATEEDLYLTITRGMPGSGMPAFGHLLPEERLGLARFVRRLGRAHGSAVAVVPDPPAFTPAMVERGRELGRISRCDICHGKDLRGLERDAHGFEWVDEAGRSMPRSTDLTSGAFGTGSDPRSLYRTLVYGHGGSPMPSYGSAFPDEDDRWALVAWVRSVAGLK